MLSSSQGYDAARRCRLQRRMETAYQRLLIQRPPPRLGPLGVLHDAMQSMVQESRRARGSRSWRALKAFPFQQEKVRYRCRPLQRLMAVSTSIAITGTATDTWSQARSAE
jgi:hypothetical protein